MSKTAAGHFRVCSGKVEWVEGRPRSVASLVVFADGRASPRWDDSGEDQIEQPLPRVDRVSKAKAGAEQTVCFVEQVHLEEHLQTEDIKLYAMSLFCAVLFSFTYSMDIHSLFSRSFRYGAFEADACYQHVFVRML